MDIVTVFNNDIADVTDLNRLSEFPRAYLELFVEAMTNGRRNVLFGTHTPVVLALVAPDVTVRIPAQYYAAEGRLRFLPQTDVVITHPSPGTDHDFGIYLAVYLEDQTETRENVDVVTFVQTPTSRVTHRLLVAEVVVTNIASPGTPPAPSTGSGVPGPGQERLGSVLLATFTWDGVAGSITITQNLADVVSIGSTGLPVHGGTHVTTDPIPYPTATHRGVMPPASLPYLKSTLVRVAKPSGSPMLITTDGTNGPAGDENFAAFNPSTAKGVLLDIDVGASLNKTGDKLHQTFGTPPGGAAGSANASARSDHKHIIFPADIQKYYNLTTVSVIGPLGCPMDPVPLSVPQSILIDATRPNQIAILQVEMITDSPDSGSDDQIATMVIQNTPGLAARFASVRSSGNADRTMNTTTIYIPLSSTGTITVLNQANCNNTTKFRIGLVGFFGQ